MLKILLRCNEQSIECKRLWQACRWHPSMQIMIETCAFAHESIINWFNECIFNSWLKLYKEWNWTYDTSFWRCIWLYLLGIEMVFSHDDVIKWKHFPRYWPFVQGIHRWPVNSHYTGQWRRALMFSLIRAWIDVWVKQPWGWWFEWDAIPLLWRHCNDPGCWCQWPNILYLVILLYKQSIKVICMVLWHTVTL